MRKLNWDDPEVNFLLFIGSSIFNLWGYILFIYSAEGLPGIYV